jgi:hypothetical protein
MKSLTLGHLIVRLFATRSFCRISKKSRSTCTLLEDFTVQRHICTSWAFDFLFDTKSYFYFFNVLNQQAISILSEIIISPACENMYFIKKESFSHMGLVLTNYLNLILSGAGVELMKEIG